MARAKGSLNKLPSKLEILRSLQRVVRSAASLPGEIADAANEILAKYSKTLSKL